MNEPWELEDSAEENKLKSNPNEVQYKRMIHTITLFSETRASPTKLTPKKSDDDESESE